MTGSIQLHSEKGLNPRLTICRNCGKDVGVALLGSSEKIYKCTSCGARSLGGRPRKGSHLNRREECPSCKAVGTYDFERNIEDHEKLPIELCNDCQKNLEAVAEEVKRGGIHWKCKDCGSAGAIKAGHPLAEAVRAHAKIAAPDPVGVEFNKTDCPLCTAEITTKEIQSSLDGGVLDVTIQLPKEDVASSNKKGS